LDDDMTITAIAIGLWLAASIPTWIFYALARRDVTAALRLRDEARQLAEISEAVHARYGDAIVRAMQETAMQEKADGASLQ
jgi:hypothetical protein